MQAVIDATKQHLKEKAEVCLVVSNDPQAYAVERSMKQEIPTLSVPHSLYPDRIDFDNAMLACVRPYRPDYIVLAGFMRVLTPVFIAPYFGRIINIHPSLLPAYPGLHTHRRVLENQEKYTGVTVHFVTPELDAGPIIAQSRIPVLPDETVDELATRVLEKEHQLLPTVIDMLCDDRLALKGTEALLDGKPIEIEHDKDEGTAWERTE